MSLVETSGLVDPYGNPLPAPKVRLLDAEPSFHSAAGDGLIIRKDQHITDDLLDDIKHARHNSESRREGEFMHVASVPTIIVEEWLRQGFDIRTASAREIVKRLKENSLDAFLVTSKRV
jgi:hypothetical protein